MELKFYFDIQKSGGLLVGFGSGGLFVQMRRVLRGVVAP